jgi:SAM-dependent methyltransferase
MRQADATRAEIAARYYAGNAEALSIRYENIAFEVVHSDLLPLIAGRTGSALDVGAGSGRDAAWLFRNGWDVTAVEPSRALLAQARRIHSATSVRWVCDKLPALSTIISTPTTHFDLILLSAVWMHVDPNEAPAAVETITAWFGQLIVQEWRFGCSPGIFRCGS